jgi:hypothetical protein
MFGYTTSLATNGIHSVAMDFQEEYMVHLLSLETNFSLHLVISTTKRKNARSMQHPADKTQVRFVVYCKYSHNFHVANETLSFGSIYYRPVMNLLELDNDPDLVELKRVQFTTYASTLYVWGGFDFNCPQGQTIGGEPEYHDTLWGLNLAALL